MSTRELRDSHRRPGLVNGGMNKRLCPVDGLRLKSEREEDIKNYAETTMNELLGWFGYDKVNSGEEARDLSLHHRTRRPSSSSASPQGTSSPGGSRGEEVSEDASEREMSGPDTGGKATPLLDVESITQRTGSETVTCAWCLKEGFKLFTLKTADGLTKAFCSELCFDQCRRAAFKKNRICDWCKHVRHTVNYVDFQDKDHQLQFCSDKCLNQYKMNIFCKETQAYLQMNPHLRDAKDGSGSSTSSLITPDLWMKDCKDFTNGHPNGSDDEDSTSLEQPLSFATGGNSQSVDSKLSDAKRNLQEDMAEESSDKGNKTLKLDNKQKSETNQIPPFDTEKPYLDRRKKHRITDRTSLFKPDRRSTRMKGLVNEDSELLPQTNAGFTSKKYFSSNRMLLQQTVSPPPPYHHPSPLLNGPMSLRNARSSSPNTSVPPIPPVSSTPANLPPPPPLLNSELLHHPFANPQMYQPPYSLFSHQQQLEALFAMQNGLGMRLGLPSQPRAPFPELLPPNPLNMNGLQPFQHPSTMMFPYPLVLPLPFPIPIPIPIPISQFENAKKIIEKEKINNLPQKTNTSATEQAKRVDSIITKLITKHHTENNSNYREMKAVKNFECNESHSAVSGRTAYVDNASSASMSFPNFTFCHDNDQTAPLDVRKGKQKRINESSTEKSKHFKTVEKFTS